MDTPDTTTPDTGSQKVLCLSDLHIGAPVSRYPKYKEYIHRLMDQADHVVLNGDIFEMFYLEKPKGVDGYDVVKSAIDSALDWLREELRKKPKRHIHFVLGNHENLRRFRNRLYKLEDEFRSQGNFHWHTEGIALGNMLFMHGDLQEHKQTDATRKSYRIPEACEHIDRDTRILNWFYEPGCAYKRVFEHGRKKDSKRTAKFLEKCADFASEHGAEYEELNERQRTSKRRGKEKDRMGELEGNILHFSRFGADEPEILTRDAYDRFDYVCFGHTHVPIFPAFELDNKKFINTGALVSATTPKPKPGLRIPLPFMECELSASGKMENIRQSQPLEVPPAPL